MFETLRDALCQTPILAYANMQKPFILTTDASTSAIGYIPSQRDQDGRERPISYGGRAQ